MKIADGRSEFYQWDHDQQLIVPAECTEVHFDNGTTKEALACLVKEDSGEYRVDVPNILLQTAAELRAYGWSAERGCVIRFSGFWVEPREKPADYVYTQTEVLSVDAAVAAALKALKDSGELTGPQGEVGPQGPAGPQGAPGEPGPAEVFIAEYGVTTYAELEAAYNDGKILFCRDGVYYSALYQRTSTGSYTFYSNDSASQVNRFCTSSGWGKKAVKLCAAAFEEMRDYIRDTPVVTYNPDEGNAANVGQFTIAEWRSFAAGYRSVANNTSFGAGRLQNATGKGSFSSSLESSFEVLKTDGSNVVLAQPVSIDEKTVELDTVVDLTVGDYIHFSPVDMPGIKATDVKRVEDVQTVDGRTVLTLDAPFRAENYHEGNGVPEDGILPAGMRLRLDFGNVASGDGAAVLGGRGNKATGDNAVVLGGKESEARAWNSLAAGWHAIAAAAGQVAFGQWNEIDTAGLFAFILGWGTKTNPKNVFTVERKGNVKAAGKFTTGAEPSEDMDLVNLAFLLRQLAEAKQVFIAEYGVTTYAELEAAYNAGKMLFCRDGGHYAVLYQRTSTGNYSFYTNDSASQVNRFCTSSGWGKKTVKLCAAAFEEMDAANKEYVDGIVGDIDSALDGIIAIQNGLIGGDGA